MSNKEYLKRIGLELKVARIRKALKQEDLVRMTGVSWGAKSRIELGKADAHILTLKRMADALDLNMKDFL